MDPALLRLLLVLLGVALTAGVGRVVTDRRDRLRPVAGGAADADGTVPIADGPTALLFGSATCAPCETVKGLLADVAATRDDFAWTAIDAADHLDLAREHGVRSVPTLLVLDPAGTVVARSNGVPGRSELADAVARAAGEAAADPDEVELVRARTA